VDFGLWILDCGGDEIERVGKVKKVVREEEEGAALAGLSNKAEAIVGEWERREGE